MIDEVEGDQEDLLGQVEEITAWLEQLERALLRRQGTRTDG